MEKLADARALLRRQPEYKLLSVDKLYVVLRREGAPLTKKLVQQLLVEEAPKEEEVRVSRRVKRPPRRYYRITAVPYSYQVDVIKFDAFRASNGGATGMLAVVDILSRKAWAYPLKGNTMKVIVAAFQSFLKDIAPVSPALVQGDNEFKSKLFKDLTAREDIVLRTAVAKDDHRVPGGGDALGIMDRFARTLRETLVTSMDSAGHNRWTTLLPTVLRAYNGSPHAAHKTAGDLSPNEVYADMDELLARRVEDLAYNQEVYAERAEQPDSLKVGDWVRIVQSKGLFQKGRAKLGVERFRVVAVRGNNRAVLEDAQGEKVKKTYKLAELTKSSAPPSLQKEKENAREAEERDTRNAKRFKRSSRLPQAPTPQEEQNAPRTTRLTSGTIKRRTWSRKEVG